VHTPHHDLGLATGNPIDREAQAKKQQKKSCAAPMQPTRSGIVGSVRDLHQFMAFKGISSQNFICFFGDSTQGCKDCNILGFHCVKSMSGNPESSPF
jgi:hypothetical protein